MTMRNTMISGFILLLFAAVGNAQPAAEAPSAVSTAEAAAALVLERGLNAAPVALRESPGWQPPRRIVVRVDGPDRLDWFRAAAPGVELVGAGSDSEALELVAGADGIVGFCSPEIISAGTMLRWIQLYSAGAGPCAAIPAVRERGILLTNMQRISSPEIAEHVLAMLLAFTRGLYLYLPEQQSGRWAPQRLSMDKAWELGGRTMLVVGLGGIGSEVAKRAHALGMRVIATRASVGAAKPAYVDYVGPPGELLRLAAEADVVVNCAPLLPATRNLFDQRFFAAVKPRAYFINVGRGGSVVHDDLVAALRDGRLSGAGLDVTDPEPLPPDHALWQLPNVIITPHVAALSDRVLGRVLLLARENLRRYAAGEAMLSVVDVERGY